MPRPGLNLIAKSLLLSWLSANTLALYGVRDWVWMLALTFPISFALYHWYGLIAVAVPPSALPKENRDE